MPTRTEQSGELMRAVLRLSRAMRAASNAGDVTLGGMAVLATLRRQGPLPASQLAAEQRLAPQSLTRVVDDLVQRNFARRERGPVDGRQVIVFPTPAGLEALKRNFAARRDWLEHALHDMLTQAEQAELLRAAGLLARLAEYQSSFAGSSSSSA